MEMWWPRHASRADETLVGKGGGYTEAGWQNSCMHARSRPKTTKYNNKNYKGHACLSCLHVRSGRENGYMYIERHATWWQLRGMGKSERTQLKN